MKTPFSARLNAQIAKLKEHSPGERRAYEHLHERVTGLACRLQLLLSDCRDGDQRVIADESLVRRDILNGMQDLCEWAGQRGRLDPAQNAPHERPARETKSHE